MQRRTCGGFADIGDYPAKCPETSDAMNKNNCRQPVVGVCHINPREYFRQFRHKRFAVAAHIEQFDYRRKFGKIIEHRQRGSDVSQARPLMRRNHRNLRDRLARSGRRLLDGSSR